MTSGHTRVTMFHHQQRHMSPVAPQGHSWTPHALHVTKPRNVQATDVSINSTTPTYNTTTLAMFILPAKDMQEPTRASCLHPPPNPQPTTLSTPQHPFPPQAQPPAPHPLPTPGPLPTSLFSRLGRSWASLSCWARVRISLSVPSGSVSFSATLSSSSGMVGMGMGFWASAGVSRVGPEPLPVVLGWGTVEGRGC